MAPTQGVADLLFMRYYYSYSCPYGSYYSDGSCYYSGWWTWGRWVLAVILIIVFFFLLVCCACIRRRRRRGMAPMYGTGWVHNKFAGPAPPYGNQGPAPPQYAANPPREFNSNAENQPSDGYYGHQQGIPLQQPPNSYYPGANPGPVPNKIS